MASIGDRIYMHEEKYHDGETGTVVALPNQYGQYTIELDAGGTIYPLESEFEVIEKAKG